MAPMVTGAAEATETMTIAVPPPAPEKAPKTALEEDEEKEQKGATNISPTLLKLKNAAEMETKAWLDAIVGETAIKVSLIRKEPKFHRDPETQQDVKVDGNLETFDRTIDEDEIQRRHGGGTFQLVVKTRNSKGQWTYFGAKTVEIAGEPSLRNIPRTPKPEKEPTIVMPQKDPTEGKIVEKMFGYMMDENRASRSQPPVVQQTGLTAETVNAMIKPLEIQISSLTKQLADKDAELRHVRENAGKDPFRDKMLDTLMDGDSARVTALRANYDSELRQLKENHRADLERERDRHQRDMERSEKAHERELAAIKASHDQSIALSKSEATNIKFVLERENKSYEKTIERLETELSTLRAKKEQSIKEKVDELQAIKELVGDGDGEEQSKLEQVIGALGNLPAVQRMAAKAMGEGEPQQAAPVQQQAAAPKPRIVRDKNTGQVSMLTPDGKQMPLAKRPVHVTVASGQQVEIPSLDPAQVAQAVTYMENAYQAGTDPETFASGARPYVPAPVMGAIRTLGITEFLSKVGKIPGTSSLATMRGRQWAKKVAAALLGEEQPADASAVPPADAPAQPDA